MVGEGAQNENLSQTKTNYQFLNEINHQQPFLGIGRVNRYTSNLIEGMTGWFMKADKAANRFLVPVTGESGKVASWLVVDHKFRELMVGQKSSGGSHKMRSC